jgi:hypothetical protein
VSAPSPRPIARESIPRALEKAERYRLLNEPFFAESICLDVLAIEPKHQKAIVLYVLSLADQLRGGVEAGMARAREAIAKLESAYEREYYTGILFERRGVAMLESHGMGARESAWQAIMDAMASFEAALPLRPAGDDDATLRWNTCARLIAAHQLSEPERQRSDFPLE